MNQPVEGDWLTPQELAAWLKVDLQTVYNWRTRGTGPTAYKVGRLLRYRKAEVTSWITESNAPTPTPLREGPVIARHRAPKRRA